MGTRIFYKDENSVILQGDMLTDEKIPENHIDLIVTSPPYNVNKDNKSKIRKCISWIEREMLYKRGIKPENIPVSSDIKKLERKVKTQENKIASNSGKLPEENNE